MPSRTETLLEGISKHSRILEIGPSMRPVAAKADGWNSVSLDHATQDELLRKYAALPKIDLSRIEPVDFVWTDGPLSGAVPAEQHATFDVVLASHVIEHTPDLIGFLDAASVLLKPDGVVVLAVPDKRYCFDFFQQLTTTAEVIDAHARRLTRHCRERAFEHFAYATRDGDLQAWGQRPSEGIGLIEDLEAAAAKAEICATSTGYHDVHAWHFVPSSFELLLLELGRLGATDWRLDRLTAPGGWEFFVRLRRGAAARVGTLAAPDLQTARLTLLQRTLFESLDQIDWLLDSRPSLSEARPGVSAWISSVAFAPGAASPPLSRKEGLRLQDRLRIVEAEREAALRRLAALESSTTWRLTAPLRGAVSWLKRSLSPRAN